MNSIFEMRNFLIKIVCSIKKLLMFSKHNVGVHTIYSYVFFVWSYVIVNIILSFDYLLSAKKKKKNRIYKQTNCKYIFEIG